MNNSIILSNIRVICVLEENSLNHDVYSTSPANPLILVANCGFE